MTLKIYLLLILCTATSAGFAQGIQNTPLDITDPAPSLHIQEWVKGKPISRFKKGHVYVLEFWATWCKPCIGAMPHLSKLASKHKGKVSIIGVNVYEEKNTTVEQIREFVHNMGDQMDYHVAIDNDNQMLNEWMNATDGKRNGIPRSFIVNAEGKLAWIGHPGEMDSVLQKVVDGHWDANKAAERRNEQRYLDSVEREARYLLNGVTYNSHTQSHDPIYATPEAKLGAVEELVQNEPKLKNSYSISYNTFSSLLQMDQKKAYEYGKNILAASAISKNHAYKSIIEVIKSYADSIELVPEIYHLGAEAYQQSIDRIFYPEITDMHSTYHDMAKWYWRANDKPGAIQAQEKAIEELKSKKDYSKSDLVRLEEQLQQFKKL